MYLNKAQIIGNLTKDPELKKMPSGKSVTNLSIATNRVWFDKTTNEKKETVEYHNIVVFGKQAETSAQYLKKGQSCFVEGHIQTRSWEDQNGGKRYATEIVADSVQFGYRKESQTNERVNKQADIYPTETRSVAEDVIEYPEDDINPDDIPFNQS